MEEGSEIIVSVIVRKIMADFSFLSDSDEEKAVQELLSQAMDQTVLEQVAKINCSGFNDSVLPTHLETRFQKLKSFPSVGSKPRCSSTHRHSASASSSSTLFKNPNKDKFESDSLAYEEDDDDNEKGKHGLSPNLEENSVEKLGNSKSGASTRRLKPSRNDEISSHSKKVSDEENGIYKNLDSEFGNEILSSSEKAPERSKPVKLKFPDGKKRLEVKSHSGSSSNSSDSTVDSLSPPPRNGCFWCSPKKPLRKRSTENNSILKAGLDWGKSDDMVTDLSNLSAKSQEKLLKKAMKEEEKINREAEKIVKWAKQASARIEVSSSIEDELSDSEIFK